MTLINWDLGNFDLNPLIYLPLLMSGVEGCIVLLGGPLILGSPFAKHCLSGFYGLKKIHMNVIQ